MVLCLTRVPLEKLKNRFSQFMARTLRGVRNVPKRKPFFVKQGEGASVVWYFERSERRRMNESLSFILDSVSANSDNIAFSAFSCFIAGSMLVGM